MPREDVAEEMVQVRPQLSLVYIYPTADIPCYVFWLAGAALRRLPRPRIRHARQARRGGSAIVVYWCSRSVFCSIVSCANRVSRVVVQSCSCVGM